MQMIYVLDRNKVCDIDEATGIGIPNPTKIYNAIGWSNIKYIEKTIVDIFPPYHVKVVLVFPHENKEDVLSQLQPVIN